MDGNMSSQVALLSSIKSAFYTRQTLKRDIFRLKIEGFFMRLLSPLSVFIPAITKQNRFKEEELTEKQRVYTDAVVVLKTSSSVGKEWVTVVDSYKKLKESHKIWEVVGSYAVTDASERTAAQIERNRHEVVFEEVTIPFISSDQTALYFPSDTVNIAALYPTLGVIFSNNSIEVFSLSDITLYYEQISYIEEKEFPKDAIREGYTWEKANLDGTIDKRFANNTQLPIASYGLCIIKGKFESKYLVSNKEALRNFVEKFTGYQKATLKEIEKD